MHAYEVTIVTTYTMQETVTVEADTEEDAVDAAAIKLEWSWARAEESNEILAIDRIK